MPATICGLTVNDFFSYWEDNGSNFVLAQNYNPTLVYNKNDIVYFNQVPYMSIVDNNNTPPLPMVVPPLWNQIALNSRALPVPNGMVASAMQKAQTEFNQNLLPLTYSSSGQLINYDSTPPVDTLTGFTMAQIAFVILSSHFLCCDLFAQQYAGQANSVNSGISVGGMSQSFKFPTNLENSRLYAKENTEYGRQYNEMTSAGNRMATVPFSI